MLTDLGLESQVKNSSYTGNLSLLQTNVSYWDWILLGISGVLAVIAEVFAYATHAENSPLIIILALVSILVGASSFYQRTACSSLFYA